MQLLNRYFDVMVKEIIAQGGMVDKFIGDCIMAVFRGEYHLDRALDTALAIRAHASNAAAWGSVYVEAAIGKAMDRDIEKRFASAAAMREEVNSTLPEGVSSVPCSRPRRRLRSPITSPM